MKDFVFEEPLVEGLIVKRTSIYTMAVNIGGTEFVCHCPTTGRIGNLDVSGLPCLLSKSKDPKRKTSYTVEAISLDLPESKDKKWIGINQNMANRFVEHYLRNGGFEKMVGEQYSVRREVFLGNSKLDFLAGDSYVEVKTPLQHLQVVIPEHVKTKKVTPFSSTDRMMRHIQGLADSLQGHQKAFMLIVFIYDNPGFKIVEKSTNYKEVSKVVSESVSKGVETWQANFIMTPERVVLEKYFPVHVSIDDTDTVKPTSPEDKGY